MGPSFAGRPASPSHWRGAGVVERVGLENRSTGNCTVGSNPTLSVLGSPAQALTSFHALYISPIRFALFSEGPRPFDKILAIAVARLRWIHGANGLREAFLIQPRINRLF
jgi:hypothetical protein